jgi:hypothetical protein
MDTYTLKTDDSDTCQDTYSLYEKEEDALKDAMHHVYNCLVDADFDNPDCPETYSLYEEIAKEYKSGHYYEALEKYNNIPDATQRYGYHIYVNVDKVVAYSKSFYDAHSIDLFSTVASVEPVILKEKPCCHCGRNNDIGIEVCWNCGNNPE